jgi:hypothetical protein
MTYDNNIDWGEIYESTWWGVGVDTNTIGWGIVYKDIADQSYWQFQNSYYQDEINIWNDI